VRRQLQPFGEEILSWIYESIVSECTREGIRPMFGRLPMVPDSAANDDESHELKLAQAAGFTVLDLDDVYHGHDRSSLWIAEWDAHPNALGHRLIADRLFELIHQSRESIFSPPKHP
jgi:hypothetical protein